MPIVHSAAAPFFFFHLFSRGRMEEMGETRVPGIKGECTLSGLFNRAAIQSKFPLEGTPLGGWKITRVTDAKGSHDGG